MGANNGARFPEGSHLRCLPTGRLRTRRHSAEPPGRAPGAPSRDRHPWARRSAPAGRSRALCFASLRLALPCSALICITLPCLASPCLALLYLALLCLALLCFTLLCFASLYLALLCFVFLALPCFASFRPALLCFARDAAPPGQLPPVPFPRRAPGRSPLQDKPRPLPCPLCHPPVLRKFADPANF